MNPHESVVEEVEPAHEAIIDVLAHLQPHLDAGPDANTFDRHARGDDEAELEGWTTNQLKAEVLRLRRAAGTPPGRDIGARSTVSRSTRLKRERGPGGGEIDASTPGGSKRKEKKVKEKVGRDEGTGKMLEKGRKTELGNAIRAKVSWEYFDHTIVFAPACDHQYKPRSPSGFQLFLSVSSDSNDVLILSQMRLALEINLDDPLPTPTSFLGLPDFQPYETNDFVPNWRAPADNINTLVGHSVLSLLRPPRHLTR